MYVVKYFGNAIDGLATDGRDLSFWFVGVFFLLLEVGF
jgi:hypothetical protein